MREVPGAAGRGLDTLPAVRGSGSRVRGAGARAAPQPTREDAGRPEWRDVRNARRSAANGTGVVTPSRPPRLGPVDLVVLVLLLGALVVAATIEHPRTDEIQIGPFHLPRLLLCQVLAGVGLLVFTGQLIRRPPGSLGVWVLLPLAVGTLLVQIVVYLRVSVLGRGGP